MKNVKQKMHWVIKGEERKQMQNMRQDSVGGRESRLEAVKEEERRER